ncbi:MAG TPA: hypothetical protein VFO98_06655 [Marmoricola sp.]|nr:hypothetical protein [Marmoricola sp.]
MNARLLASLLVACVLLTGCGDESKPDSADAFCAAAAKLDSASGNWHASQVAARAWREVGLPDDAPANVRRGFGLGLRLIVTTRSQKQLDHRVRLLSPIQHDDLKAVDGYVAETCPS